MTKDYQSIIDSISNQFIKIENTTRQLDGIQRSNNNDILKCSVDPEYQRMNDIRDFNVHKLFYIIMTNFDAPCADAHITNNDEFKSLCKLMTVESNHMNWRDVPPTMIETIIPVAVAIHLIRDLCVKINFHYNFKVNNVVVPTWRAFFDRYSTLIMATPD